MRAIFDFTPLMFIKIKWEPQQITLRPLKPPTPSARHRQNANRVPTPHVLPRPPLAHQSRRPRVPACREECRARVGIIRAHEGGPCVDRDLLKWEVVRVTEGEFRLPEAAEGEVELAGVASVKWWRSVSQPQLQIFDGEGGDGDALEIRERWIAEGMRRRRWGVADPGDRLISHIAALELVRPYGLEHLVQRSGVCRCLVYASVEKRNLKSTYFRGVGEYDAQKFPIGRNPRGDIERIERGITRGRAGEQARLEDIRCDIRRDSIFICIS